MKILTSLGLALGAAGLYSIVSGSSKSPRGTAGQNGDDLPKPPGGSIVPGTPTAPILLSGVASSPIGPSGVGALAYAPANFASVLPWTLCVYVRGNARTVLSTFTTLGFGRVLESSGKNLLWVMPERDPVNSGYGSWSQAGTAKKFVDEVLARPDVRAKIGKSMPARIAVLSHSGGYGAAAAMISRNPGLGVSSVTLFDSLYGNETQFEDYVLAGGTLFNVTWTVAHDTNAHSKALMASLKKDKVDYSNWGTKIPDVVPLGVRVGFGQTTTQHDGIPGALLPRFLRRVCA